MANYGIKGIGFKEFQKAIERNPQFVATEVKKFITRALAKYKSGILNTPWRIGASGGGSPVATLNGGNLRDTHYSEVGNFEGRIYPTASYSQFVHEGTSKMKPRPWLDFVKKDKDKEIEELEKEMLNGIVKNLAK